MNIILEKVIEFKVWEELDYFVICAPRGISLYLQKDGTVCQEDSMEGSVVDLKWRYENILAHWSNYDEATAFLKEWNKHQQVKRIDFVENIER